MTRHHLFNPEGLPPATGFSYGAVTAAGRTLYVAGVTGNHPDLSIDESLVDQFRVACGTLATVIGESGGEVTDLVSLTIYTTDVSAYKDNLEDLGAAYRGVFGKHFPPAALIGVAELFDPAAKVELVGTAVVPDQSSRMTTDSS